MTKGDWQYERDAAFSEFVRQMPATHWAKYDLSAVRLGWEARKAYDHGKQARTDGVARENNPYRKVRGFGRNYDTHAVWWDKGWQEGKQKPRTTCVARGL